MPGKTTASSTRTAPSLKGLLAKLKGLQTSFNNIVEFVDNYNGGSTANQVAVRLERLDDLWERIGDTICDVESHENFTGEESFLKERSEFENRY